MPVFVCCAWYCCSFLGGLAALVAAVVDLAALIDGTAPGLLLMPALTYFSASPVASQKENEQDGRSAVCVALCVPKAYRAAVLSAVLVGAAAVCAAAV